MFNFNNTHIFTGYLKQLLSTFNIPTCKIYTKEFSEYLKKNGKEDPRVIESFDTINQLFVSTQVSYLRNGELRYYFWDRNADVKQWKLSSNALYDEGLTTFGLTKRLRSSGIEYDYKMHEYLGDYLRFLRDFYGVNLMSMYNCFSNKQYTNLYYKLKLDQQNYTVDIDSSDSNYAIYALPVKLFENYTIAIDSTDGIEMFCGMYKTSLDTTNKYIELIKKTYKKVNSTSFNKPFLYNCLDVEFWNLAKDKEVIDSYKNVTLSSDTKRDKITRWDIVAREQDLKLFIKVPVTCKSSIVVLEGDFRGYNDCKYEPSVKKVTNRAGEEKPFVVWNYAQNSSVLNFERSSLKLMDFKPISKLQLLAVNTGESYPYADRLIEYLSGYTITSMEDIPDNIKRAQAVMEQSNYTFTTKGVWEDYMQKLAYNYMMNVGPISADSSCRLVDAHKGYNPKTGLTTKSTLYDILGYIDRDTERSFSSWTVDKDTKRAIVKNSIQNVDIYNGLFELD